VLTDLNQVCNNKEYEGDNMFIKKYNKVYRQSLNFKTDSNSLLVRLKLLYMIQQYFNKIYKLLHPNIKQDMFLETNNSKKISPKFEYKLNNLRNYIQEITNPFSNEPKSKKVSFKTFLADKAKKEAESKQITEIDELTVQISKLNQGIETSKTKIQTENSLFELTEIDQEILEPNFYLEFRKVINICNGEDDDLRDDDLF
jgi:hypothetical protein